MLTLNDFEIGDRVELHPATDLWMRGARYGKVIAAGRRFLSVLLDANGRRVRIIPANVGRIITEADRASTTVLFPSEY